MNQKNKKVLSGQTVLVLGGGVTGTSVIHFLKKHSATPILVDKNSTELNVPFFPDSVALKELPHINIAIKSPGISPEHWLLQELKEKGIPILSEIQFARQFFAGQTIGITGTDGKSTTTALTEFLIKTKYPKTRMGGNIGISFSNFCDEDLDYAILELSSYQLEDSEQLFLDQSAILNIANDHLERHKTMDRYRLAKQKIIYNSEEHTTVLSMPVFLNLGFRDRLNCSIKTFGNTEACSARIDISTKKIITQLYQYSYQSFPLVGYHNIENLAAALLLSESAGCDPLALQDRLQNFKGLPHRFEFVKKIGNTGFINDSKSTNLNSMLSGLQGFANSNKIGLILGGQPKIEPIEPMLEAIKKMNAVVFLIGEAGKLWKEPLHSVLKDNLVVTNSLEKTFEVLEQKMNQYNFHTVILSPACASFDQFKNFEERGKLFVSLVDRLSKIYENNTL
jgi:UDP-N-acetylmuramoylalanine--D-glutamate ligase